MGRNKKINSEKKVTITFVVSQENFDKLNDLSLKSNSGLINWLLEEHFNLVRSRKEGV
jgi:hypothetical protein